MPETQAMKSPPRVEETDKKDIIDALKCLTEQDFIEVFYQATKNRKLVDDLEVSYCEAHWVMATVDRLLGNNGKWEPYDISFLALHDSKEHPKEWVSDAIVCQSGKCTNCDNQVISWSKQVICPVCSHEAYGS